MSNEATRPAIDSALSVLCDADTLDWIRNATDEETAASIEAAATDGGYGFITVDGRTCFVEE